MERRMCLPRRHWGSEAKRELRKSSLASRLRLSDSESNPGWLVNLSQRKARTIHRGFKLTQPEGTCSWHKEHPPSQLASNREQEHLDNTVNPNSQGRRQPPE